MIFKTIFLVLTAFIILMTTIVWSQDLMIYPAKGQSNDQMEKDKFECYTWAKGQTGFDPMQMPTASSPPPTQEKKSVGGGILKGGVIGGAGGASALDGGEQLVGQPFACPAVLEARRTEVVTAHDADHPLHVDRDVDLVAILGLEAAAREHQGEGGSEYGLRSHHVPQRVYKVTDTSPEHWRNGSEVGAPLPALPGRGC